MTDRPNLPGSFKLPGRSLKPGWQVYRFDQIAINVNDRIEPGDTDAEYYIGLEHLDSDSLKIRRWGQPSEVEATKLRFCKGDIIFGRRRAYQRKLGIAEFDGICSAHAMVLRPKTEVVLPEFLPFFMQSDLFMNRALEISVGSLSPTINWRTLAEQEFALPPLTEQRRLAEVLWANLGVIEALRGAVESSICTEDAFLLELFGLYTNDNPRWQKIRLDQLAYIQTGVAKGKKADPEKTIDVPYIGVSNVQDGFLDLSEIKLITVEKDKVEQVKLQTGDVLMTEGGDPDKLGRGTVWQGEIEGCIHQNHIFAVRSNPNQLNPWFLAAVARSSYGKQYFLSCSKRTSNLATINKTQVSEFLVPCPDIIKQKEIVSDWRAIRSASDQVRKRLRQTQQIQNSLLNSTFGATE